MGSLRSFTAPLYYAYSGWYNNGGGVYGQGSYGLYWSSQAYSATSGYLLNFITGFVYPQFTNFRNSGFTVRCLLRE